MEFTKQFIGMLINNNIQRSCLLSLEAMRVCRNPATTESNSFLCIFLISSSSSLTIVSLVSPGDIVNQGGILDLIERLRRALEAIRYASTL